MAGRQHFDRDATFVARHAFAFDGKSYQAGDVFPWRDLGVTELRLGQFWRACLIDCLPRAVAPAPVADPQPSAAVAPGPEPTSRRRRQRRAHATAGA